MTTAADDTLTQEALDSITVETATATPEELDAHLAAGTDAAPETEVVEAPVGDEAEVVKEPPQTGATEKPPKPAAAADTRSEFEKQVDELDPPLLDETPKQRAERMSRGERRILGLLHRAKSIEAEFQTAQAEIARLKAAPAGTRTEPPTTTTKVEPPPFAFPTWDQYSEQHPEATHEEYIDARTDARRDWHATKERLEAEAKDQHDKAAAADRDAAQRRTALETLDREKVARVEAYRAATPEYDAALAAAADLPLPPEMHIALARSPIGPKIAHYLALHRDEHLRIARLHPMDMVGEIRLLQEQLKGDTPVTTPPPPAAGATPPPSPGTTPVAAPAAATPPSVTVPSRPTSSAPAPTSEVHGRATPTRSLQTIADADGEDATEYMQTRMRQRKEVGLRG